MQAHRACTSRTRVWKNCRYGVGADVKGVSNYFGSEVRQSCAHRAKHASKKLLCCAALYSSVPKFNRAIDESNYFLSEVRQPCAHRAKHASKQLLCYAALFSSVPKFNRAIDDKWKGGAGLPDLAVNQFEDTTSLRTPALVSVDSR